MYRGDVHVEASIELISDSNIASQVGVVMVDSRNNLEASAFAAGILVLVSLTGLRPVPGDDREGSART